jgi:hypothetical protein
MTFRRSPRTLFALGGSALVLATIAAFAIHHAHPPGPRLHAAPEGRTPTCARVTKTLPTTLGGLRRSPTHLPGVAAWGNGEVVLHCGLRPPLPSTNPCVNVNGVDWLVRTPGPHDTGKTLITFGRSPAVEVSLSNRTPQIDAALVDLSRVVKPVHQRDTCT